MSVRSLHPCPTASTERQPHPSQTRVPGTTLAVPCHQNSLPPPVLQPEGDMERSDTQVRSLSEQMSIDLQGSSMVGNVPEEAPKGL